MPFQLCRGNGSWRGVGRGAQVCARENMCSHVLTCAHTYGRRGEVGAGAPEVAEPVEVGGGGQGCTRVLTCVRMCGRLVTRGRCEDAWAGATEVAEAMEVGGGGQGCADVRLCGEGMCGRGGGGGGQGCAGADMCYHVLA